MENEEVPAPSLTATQELAQRQLNEELERIVVASVTSSAVHYGRGVVEQQRSAAETADAELRTRSPGLLSTPPSLDTTVLRTRYDSADDAYVTTTRSGHVFVIPRFAVENSINPQRSLSERLHRVICERPTSWIHRDSSAYHEAQGLTPPPSVTSETVTVPRLSSSELNYAGTFAVDNAFGNLVTTGVDSGAPTNDTIQEATQQEWLVDILDLMRAYDKGTKPDFDEEVIRYIKSMSHTIQAALISLGALDD